MGYTQSAPGHFEVSYANADDMDPSRQPELVAALTHALTRGPVSVLFTVETLNVPASVPEFWLGVTKALAPKLCALAIVSDSLAVRATASGFSVANHVRHVPLEVRAFAAAELETARAWCRARRHGVRTEPATT